MAKVFHYGIMEARMTHEATIDEKELRGVLLARSLGLSHEAAYLHQRCLDLQGQQLFAELLAKDADDALQGTACRQLH